MKELNLNNTKILNKSGSKCYDLVWGGTLQLKRIGNYLYNNNNICLERKYNKFKEVGIGG